MNTSVADAATDLSGLETRKSRTGLKIILVATAIVVLLAYGIHWWMAGRYREKTDDAYVGGDLTIIGSKVTGYVTKLPVVDNQLVHAGDLLILIDDRDYRAIQAKAASAVDAQRAAVANLDAGEALQRALIARAKAEIDAMNAEAVRSQEDFRRYQDLVSRSAVSIESAQRTEATYKVARANTARASADLLAAQRQLNVIATQKQQVTAAVEEARAESDIAQLNVGYTELRAPIEGYIGNRRARVGMYATAGTQLLSVVPANGLWVDANFKEDQIARMQVGQPVTIRADVLPGKEFHGHVDSLAPATGAQFSILPPENATGNFTKIVQRVAVRIRLDATDSRLGQLRPGLSVVAEIDTKSIETNSRGDSVAEAGTR
jgi:membrane fusion protein, multidrug efflux system